MGKIFELIKAYTTGNSEYGDGRPDWVKDMIKDSSVPLEDGGDTHIHPWKDGEGVTVTTRLPGGIDDHVDFRDDESSSRDDTSDPPSRDFDPSPEAGEAFRSVFGDDNK